MRTIAFVSWCTCCVGKGDGRIDAGKCYGSDNCQRGFEIDTGVSGFPENFQGHIRSAEERDAKVYAVYIKRKAEARNGKAMLVTIVDLKNRATYTNRKVEYALVQVTKTRDGLIKTNKRKVGIESSLKELEESLVFG